MGQQQLILLLVVIVVVAIGIAGGVHAYGVGKVQSQQDAFAVEAMEIAFEVVAWQKRPMAMGGNDGNTDLARLSLSALGRNYTSSSTGVSYLNAGDRRISIDVTTPEGPIIQIYALPVQEGAQSYELAMWGEDDDCWAFRIQKYQSGSWSLISGAVTNPDSGACSWT